MEEQYWNELSSAVDTYLKSVGIHVELDEMSPEEIKFDTCHNYYYAPNILWKRFDEEWNRIFRHSMIVNTY